VSFDLPDETFTVKPASVFWSPRFSKDGSGQKRTKTPKQKVPHADFEERRLVNVGEAVVVKSGEDLQIKSSTDGSREFVVRSGSGVLGAKGKEWEINEGSRIYVPVGEEYVAAARADEDLVLSELKIAE
jgi:mannose-6-phosphate isomerase-like protein (cupin superfamily)